MRKYLNQAFFLLVLLIAGRYCTAQSKTYIYYLNKNFQPAAEKDAVFVGKGTKKDSVFQVQFFSKANNKLLLTEQFKDSTASVLHGLRILYHPNNTIAEYATYSNNKLNGLFLKRNEKGQITDSTIYLNGAIQSKTHYDYSSKGHLANSLFIDSVNNTLNEIFYDTLMNKTAEVFFVGNNGTWKHYKKDGTITVDTLVTRESSEATFIGNWAKFLLKNINGWVAIRNGATGGSGKVIVQFIVEKDGSISNIKAITNIGYGTEEEAVRVIKRSPKWKPAIQYGIPVKAYRKQPITFNLSRR